MRKDSDAKVLDVALNRPDKLNAMNSTLFKELKACMEMADMDSDIVCVVLHQGSSRVFSAGLDLQSESEEGGILGKGGADVSRRGLRMLAAIDLPQQAISSVERCKKPVICALHGAVVGGGVDLACACDIRYCTKDAFFTIAEVKVGLAADIGTLQRLPKIVGNDSVVRELALSGRKLPASEALQLGLVGRVMQTPDECLAAARDMARQIAALSPIAVIGTKVSLNYSRDHTTQEGLEHIKIWNSMHLQSDDVASSMKAQMSKKTAVFSKL